MARSPAPATGRAPLRNADIAVVFEEIADLLEIEGENPFRIRAYRNAARVLRGLRDEAADMLAAGRDLSELPGIGTDLAGKITDLVRTGTTGLLDRLHKELPPSLAELLRIPGLGPKRVATLYRKLKVTTPAQLQAAARAGKLARLAGFGPKIVEKITTAAETKTAQPQRLTLAAAMAEADPLVAMLQKAPGVKQVTLAGSYRRGRETVGDLDILATAAAKSPVMDRFVAYERVQDVLSHGETRSSVVLRGGLQVDLRVVADDEYGAALHYFTGSKAHNIAIRRLGQQRGLKINEYGVFKGERRVAGATEESVFAAVELPFIPPELREDRGEIDAARKGRLPALVDLGDLRGDLHIHTAASDGHATLAEMAEAARARGLSYLAVTEHSRRLGIAHGLDAKRLGRQLDEIDTLNARLKGITLLKGIEVDILENGSLDLPDSVLARLDLVVGAIHSHFDLPEAKQTRRILKAFERPYFTILAHPGGRLLGQREACRIDMAKVIATAGKRPCYLELNAQPDRLDLIDIYCQAAKGEGVLVAINSDAHAPDGFDSLRFGVLQARRGWLEKDDVLNTRSLAKLRPLLARTMGR